MSLAALLIAGARARVTVRRGGAVCVRVLEVFLADCVFFPPVSSTEWHDRCVAVFRVVVAGRYLVCRFN